ncbi:ankyrin repeat-containing protein ITN1-like [Prunus dulcis]|uniref:ankyrin repeat-containing protein ITN1-like n=1 Tax=Prunus dulcis TaxID=3755 RepID=UPI0014833C5A|nr:ankyrin repeat-containing protein ITN1-like [Prunus dulcis]
MDCGLHDAAIKGDLSFLKKIRNGDGSIDLARQKTPNDNNVLHIAAEFKQMNFFKEVKFHHSQSPRFWDTNKNRETPLHVAARVGCDEIVEFIIANMKPLEEVDLEDGPINEEAYKKLLRMENSEKDTALHVAVRYRHDGVVAQLMKADPELCCFTNSAAESPLFLAVRTGSPSIALYILNESPSDRPPSFQGTNGVTALHAAVTRRRLTHQGIVATMVSKNHEIIKQADDIGWTPLHYAALSGNLKATQLLIGKEKSACYILDKLGLSALHIAAYAGRTKILEELIGSEPATCDLVNHKGQTALHAAVVGEKINVIKYVLKTPKLGRLINQADNEGNTPLHLAAICRNHGMIKILSTDTRLDKTAINKKFLTVADILREDKMEQKYIWALTAGVPYFQQQITLEFTNLESPEKKDEADTPAITHGTLKRHDTKLLVATLIATVTFAASINVPGGFKTDGRPALEDNAYFRVCGVFNMYAFIFSVLAISNECTPLRVLSSHLPTPASLIQFSIGGMVIAFFAAILASLQPKRPNESLFKYLFVTPVDLVLGLIFVIFVYALVLIPIYRSLLQIMRGIRIRELRNYVI